ncbi:2-O-methyltransferase NoeI [Stieleria neptunia]|uniref:2-O-methyltransferase NoeI n=1 Tax=Stieleria neptunia TaxID=2527979 RepID=A0A518HQS7_9BACT|nr:FkbM family methyltransferase [Stieleria neptunia]QDV43151.1 2-O-methyltransferase NoeI [Stieleria neptunia]
MSIKRAIAAVPFLKRMLVPLYDRMRGLPPLDVGEIDEDTLRRAIDKPNPTILEIGANDGMHTVWFRKIFPDATIHCFEPDARAIQRFHERVGKDAPGIFLHQSAVGPINGDVTFYPSDSCNTAERESLWDCSGSLKQPTGHLDVHPEIAFADPITIPSVRLDDWRVKHGVGMIDFIWMDVQGAELDVFSSAASTLESTRYLYTEYVVEPLYKDQPTLTGLVAALPSFRIVKRYRNDILLKNRSLAQ